MYSRAWRSRSSKSVVSSRFAPVVLTGGSSATGTPSSTAAPSTDDKFRQISDHVGLAVGVGAIANVTRNKPHNAMNTGADCIIGHGGTWSPLLRPKNVKIGTKLAENGKL